MKSKLLLLAIAVVLFAGTSAFAQDPNLPDTVDFVLNVDTTAGTMEMEVWVFNDELVVGSTFGFTWANSPGTNLTLDSAVATQLIDDGYDIIFFYEDDNLATSNANMRALFGGALFISPGIPADASGRRLWATYYFSMPQPWNGAVDGIEIDTLRFSGGSDYRFISNPGNVNFFPVFTGKVQYGEPGLSAGDQPQDLPASYALAQNYPNPFNPSTDISFDLPRSGKVNLTVYNILGQAVTTLVDRELDAGSHTITWDASENATGVYFYKLTAGDFTETRKMMLLK